MKFSVLMENTACSENFDCEHGLSLYIEACGHKILFDSGQSGSFADNAEKLGIDLSAVDIAVLSHGHYDHGGGISRFLEINDHAPVYMNIHAFEGHYNGTGKYIGLDKKLEGSERIVFVGSESSPAEGLKLFPAGGHKLMHPVDSSGLTVKRGGQFLPEDYIHEQYLLIEENGKRILVSGCSHRGILNITERFRPDVLIGGFHFMEIDASGEGLERLQKAAEELLKYDTQYYTGHCTGLEQFKVLKNLMGERITYIPAGMSFEM